jgi:hypothetical protein
MEAWHPEGSSVVRTQEIGEKFFIRPDPPIAFNA